MWFWGIESAAKQATVGEKTKRRKNRGTIALEFVLVLGKRRSLAFWALWHEPAIGVRGRILFVATA